MRLRDVGKDLVRRWVVAGRSQVFADRSPLRGKPQACSLQGACKYVKTLFAVYHVQEAFPLGAAGSNIPVA
jgi:hypothetical protein